MAYYDNVKDSVKQNEKDKSGKSNFDTLKEKVSEEVENEEEEDDTPIEVVAEDGIEKESTSGKDKKEDGSGENPFTSDTENSGSESIDAEGLEQRLDKIIEQNQKMIEILESFGN
jgi:hypothetical protein